jgi:hypothetical protein
VKHLDHAVNLTTSRFATGFLECLETLKIGQLLEITLVVFVVLFGGVRLLNLFGGRLLLLGILFLTPLLLIGSGGSLFTSINFELGLGLSFLSKDCDVEEEMGGEESETVSFDIRKKGPGQTKQCA